MNHRLRFFALVAFFLGLVSPAALPGLEDDFDSDPSGNPEFELHEPQTGVVYSIVADGGNNWWRWQIPALGDLGLNWDSWTTVDRAPKLRHAVGAGEDWVIQTRLRIDPAAPPAAATNNFLAGLMIQFSEFDLVHWNIGQLRSNSYNIFMERSGSNNLITAGYETGLLSGTPVRLMVEKVGTIYSFYYSLEADGTWVLAGNYEFTPAPTYVGLIMKTWGSVAFNVDWDYFYMPPPAEAPTIVPSCDFGDPDTAMVGVPYTRAMQLGGWPAPSVTATSGPALTYDEALGVLTGWVPDTAGEVAIEIEAANAGGSATLAWTVDVLPAPEEYDDEFDEDPRDNLDYWEYYEPQGGIAYSIVENGGTNWWRMEVPLTGDGGVAFDGWTTVDNAPQLRHPIVAGSDFLIETRVRIDDAVPPLAADAFLSGLLVYFSQYDMITWCTGQERILGGETYNIVMERSGANNLVHTGYEPALLSGTAVSLRVEKKCDVYYFSYRLESDGVWTLAGTYETATPPVAVGLSVKTWGAGTVFTTDFDYFHFVGEAIPRTAPEVSAPCDFGDPDIAWLGMPYARPIGVDGFPKPSVAVTAGPAGLAYDAVNEMISGWTPDAAGEVSVTVEGTNALGTDTLDLNVEVLEDPETRDDELDEDPLTSAYWTLYEPQTGIAYSTVDDGGNSWWRLDVPLVGDDGLDFDTWTTVDRAPQLRHAVEEGDDFVIETRVRIDPTAPPAATDLFFAGLMVYFSQYDLIQWTVGNERTFGLSTKYNMVMERSGFGNLIRGGYEPGLISGTPVRLRIEKKCDLYNFFYRRESDTAWTLAGSHVTSEPPLYVGLLMKTWAGGVALTVDFDYFDILDVGGPPLPTFVRGDPDASGIVDLSDGVRILSFLYTGGAALECEDAGDTDDNGRLEITDAIKIFGYLYLGNPAPVPPSPSMPTYAAGDCGVDAMPEDAMGCGVVSATCRGP